MAKKIISQNAVGTTFHHLTVEKEFVRNWKRYWRCRCMCGIITTVPASNVKSGNTKSCGCQKYHSKHGRTRTPEYWAWQTMRDRCANPHNQRYQRYGARGIRVCSQWLTNFSQFFADMGPRPSSKYSLERIDNDGNYEPKNCKWATDHEQTRNTRRTQLFTYSGRTMCIKDWAIETGLPYTTMSHRLKHWPIKRAIEEPSHRGR